MMAIALAAALAVAPLAVAEPPVYETTGCLSFTAGTELEFPQGFPGSLLIRETTTNPFASGEGSTTRLCMAHPGYGPGFAVRVLDDGTEEILLFTGDPDVDLASFLTGIGAPAEDFLSLGLTPPQEPEAPTDGPTAGPKYPQAPTTPTPAAPPFNPLPLLAGGTIFGGLATAAAVVWFTLRRRPAGKESEEDGDA